MEMEKLTKENLRIIFMGTPEFAVGTLQALVEGGYNVVAVVTQPDKPVGRHGSILRAPAVKEYALSKGIPVLHLHSRIFVDPSQLSAATILLYILSMRFLAT